MKKKYKKIETDNKGVSKNKINKILGELSSKYPVADVYFKYKNNKIIAFINRIDLDKFKKSIKGLSKKYNISYTKSCLSDIVEEIEKLLQHDLGYYIKNYQVEPRSFAPAQADQINIELIEVEKILYSAIFYEQTGI